MSLLQVTNLTKRFGGLAATSCVELSVNRGEVVGLIGPNGAGKTTLVNLLAGELVPTEGEIMFNSKEVTRYSAHQRCSMGIARTFQIPQPFHDLSVRDNVLIGHLFGKARVSSASRSDSAVDEILDSVGLYAMRDSRTATLTTAGLKKLEVARALATEPSLLLLDEPLGGLNSTEVHEALRIVKNIRSRGIAVIFIEHIVPAVMAISDRVLVLVNGKKIAEGAPEIIIQNTEVKRSYLGDVKGTLNRRSAAELKA